MKKILFGSAAAIMTVAGMSSFKASHKFAGPYFTINSGFSITPGSGNAIPAGEATLFTGDPVSGACGSGTAFDCVVSFPSGALNGPQTQLAHTSPVSSTYAERTAQ
jgi:hypothetical protein